jgi:hypothetical protein
MAVEQPILERRVFAIQKYHCRHCGTEVMSKGIPIGWYIVKKSRGPEENLQTVAILCSMDCLILDSVHEMLQRAKNRGGY